MARKWMSRDERQFEHVKKTAASQGGSTETARRIAAAVVDKTRKRQGRTARSTAENPRGTVEAGPAPGKRAPAKKGRKK